ncbi:MAG TPA: M14 family metallopeptidase [Bacteroidia bacterium]|nr:M14 family metallopeptidase [Bacteroidia bacterium]
MKSLLLPTLLCCIFCLNISAQKLSEKYLKNETVTYDECIAFYKLLAQKHSNAKLITCGLTDVGKPLHLFVITSDGDFNPSSIQNKNKRILLINNGIHPGEPDGIDASMKFSEDILTGKIPDSLLNHIVICIIPVYNIDGALSRGCCSRSNQNGPKEYGFRGNARNLDLNRDFIKCDSENSKSFAKIFREWDPDVFIDTHVSDGADYPYTMTLISSQHNKLNHWLGNYLKIEMTPALFQKMLEKNDEMIPYVNSFNWEDPPDKGIVGFLEIPRFSTGYATLFNTISFVAETHVFKPFPVRVKSTYNLLKSLLEVTDADYIKIGDLRKKAKQDCATRTDFDLQWQADTAKFELINFQGYEAKYKKSTVTGLQRMYYDHAAPYAKTTKFYDEFKATTSVKKPETYILPQAWKEVIERMKLNDIEMARLSRDTMLDAEVYYIEDYATSHEPYEGHYLHSNVKLRKENQLIQFHKGDFVINVNTKNNRYAVETLEPQGVDSYFAWGFFDAILQQKEWFSPFVFEEKAEEILKQHPGLKADFETKQKQDTAFAKDAFSQLNFIYRHSDYFEKTYKRYPVVRLNAKLNLPVE